MKLEESYDKRCCDECDTYDYVFEITVKDNEFESLKLCKKCLLRLLQAIIERQEVMSDGL